MPDPDSLGQTGRTGKAAAARHTERSAIAGAAGRRGTVLATTWCQAPHNRPPTHMTSFALDTRYALRVLRANPLTSLAALLSLALGIGATTAMFTVVDAVLLRPLPFPAPDRLVRVWTTTGDRASRLAAPADFLDWREARGCEGLAAMFDSNMSLVDGSEPAQVRVVSVSANFFELLRVAPLHGRVFTASEDAPGSGRVVVLGAGLWQRRYGSAPDVVGRQVTLGGRPATIVGVAPEAASAAATLVTFAPAERAPDVWLLGEKAIPEGAPVPGDQSVVRDAHYLAVVGRLRPGVSVRAAQAELEAIADRLARTHPATNEGVGVRLEPLHSALVADSAAMLIVLLAAVAFLLVIASVNAANLLLARGAGRGRELAVRQALGASRQALVRQMLVESLLLAVASGLLGIAVAAWGVDVLVSLAPAELPRFEQITLDARALAFTLLASVVVGLVFGSWPALRVSRPEPVRALRGSGRATGARDERRAMQVLVGVELAIAQVLLVAGGLLLASFGRLVAIEPGFDPRGVLVAEVSMPAAKAANPGRKAQFIAGVLDRLAILPGVDQVASTLTPPMSPSINRGYRIPGRPEPERRDDGGTAFRTVSNDFFALLAIRVVRGRAFDRTDSAGSEPVAVVNEAFVRRAFRGADPIGQHVTLHNLPRRIVGVVADTRQAALSRPAEPEVYVPVSQDGEPWNSVSFLVRTQGSPSALAESVRQAVLAVDPEQPLSRVETLEQAMATSLATRRFTLTLTAVFAGIALLLAAIGTFGVMSHAVAQRTRDLGIRIALGATPNQVLAYALRGSAWLTLAAVGVGLVGGGLVGRAIRGLLYQVGPANTLTLAGSGLALATVAMLASYVPVRRAIAADPVRSLRVD